MSYDISIGFMNRNMTSNVAKMWDRAMPVLNMRDMNGKLASECLPHLTEGALHMAQHRQSYQDMEPVMSGWGSAFGALTMLVEMAEACRQAPDQQVSVHC